MFYTLNTSRDVFADRGYTSLDGTPLDMTDVSEMTPLFLDVGLGFRDFGSVPMFIRMPG